MSFSPALEGRNRLTALLRIITIIPAYVFTLIVVVIATVCILLGFFAVLFTGRWPYGLRRFVVGSNLVNLRYCTYGLLLTDQFPPFSID